MKRTTQTDIADYLGISRATVSYVLNGKAGGRVPISEETRQRVLKTATRLNYEPDARARSLRSGSSKTIGLLIPDLSNPHFWQIINGAMHAAQKAGFDLVLSSSDLDAQLEEASLKALAQRRIDGLILLPAFTSFSAELFTALKKKRTPLTMIGVREGFDSIGADYHFAAKQSIQHLIDLGHRRIAFIHGVANPVMGRDRLQAYYDSLQSAEIPVDPALIINCGATVEDGYHAAHQLLTNANRPTAIVVINDLLAQGVIRAAHDLDLHLPQDCSIIGFDNIPSANYMVPRLTTVETNAADIGYGAVELLLKRLKDLDHDPRVVHIPGRLIVRESTAVVQQRGAI